MPIRSAMMINSCSPGTGMASSASGTSSLAPPPTASSAALRKSYPLCGRSLAAGQSRSPSHPPSQSTKRNTNYRPPASTSRPLERHIEGELLSISSQRRMLRASVGGLCVGRRREVMAPLLSSPLLLLLLLLRIHPPPKPSPPSTSPPPPSAFGSARASRFYLLLACAAARRDPESSPPLPVAEEKKSLAVRTGELFLGMTALFVRARRGTAPLEELEERERVIWEQRPEDVESERQRQRPEVATASPRFSFSAAGLLFPYHISAAQYLLEKGYITVTKILAENCRSNGTAFRLEAVLKDVLEKFLLDDLHIRCNGRIHVAITRLSWRPRGLLVDQFDSKEDVINALITSSFISGYLAPRPATFFRNRLCIDGGLTLFMPPTSASETVRICAFPASRLGLQGSGISPDCNPENPDSCSTGLWNLLKMKFSI